MEPLASASPLEFGRMPSVSVDSDDDVEMSDHTGAASPTHGTEHTSAPPMEEKQPEAPDAGAAATTEVAKASTSAVLEELVTTTPSLASVQEHPFYRQQVTAAEAYIRLEQERNQLLADLKQAKLDQQTAATRMTELEAENENAKKALEEAKKREDEKRDSEKTQVERLLSRADVVGRVCGGAPPANASSDNYTLDQAVGFVDRVCAYASAAMAKSSRALATVHQGIFPNKPAPSDIDTLASPFGTGSTIMADYTRAQTVRGSELTFQLLLGHQVAGDFDKVISQFPKKPDGKTRSLSAVKPEASRLAKEVVSLFEKRVAKAGEAAARKSRSMSESVS